MEKWIYAVHTNCLELSREKEFNEWYDNVHLPDILETPGVTRATRYEIGEPAEGQGKFLALYEVETGDIDQTMAALRENVSKKREQGRVTELVSVVSRSLYKQITKTQASKK
ncbi:MAG: DUF4286 family protein [Acidiferrobacterales bacterium]|jgi:hypothetical protein